MSHYIEKCECGTVLRQCRCPGFQGKYERVVGPCTHDVETGVLEEPVPEEAHEYGVEEDA